MSTRLALWTLVVILAVLGAAFARAAWTTWPAVLQYRIHRVDRQTTALVQQYLDGRQPVESVARRLASLYAEKTLLSSRLSREVPPPPGGGSLQAILIVVPSGLSPDDPRMKSLGNRLGEYLPAAMDRLRAANQ
jgi:hypothetical protein